MSSSFEKSVKGATKPKLAPPKSKYIEHILQATRTGEAGVAELFRVLSLRLRDSTWTIAFKGLVVIHLMMREGQPNVTLRYLSTDPRRMVGLNNYIDVQNQGKNVRNYSQYIVERAMAFQKVKVDYVLSGSNRLKSLSVDKGLLRETEVVQDQIKALVKCDFFAVDEENEITLTAFRLLTMDLLALYQVMNEGTISVLEHYFEMSRPDAERALEIYKSFAQITESVVRFLAVARDHQQSTRLEIPKLKHAPTVLASSLEEYLNDPDFETNRRQYIAQQQAKRGIKPSAAVGVSSGTTPAKATDTASKLPESKPSANATTSPAPKGPAPDLIDFFDYIEQNQQPMAQDATQFQQQAYVPPYAGPPQPTGYPQPSFAGVPTGQFVSQATGNPFMQFQQQPQQPQFAQQASLQPQFTGAGFGGYTPQPQPQQQISNWSPNNGNLDQFGQQPFGAQQPQQIQEQPTNPFRKSMMINPGTGSFSPSTQQTGSNPFAIKNTIPEENTLQQDNTTLGPQTPYSQANYTQATQGLAQIQPQQTGTNPFARNQSPRATQPEQGGSSPAGAVLSNPTGSTNPFKQSAFVNQKTGLGWQMAPQNSMGGLEQLDTVPVFPRPGQSQQQFSQSSPQNQQQNQSQW